MPGAERDLSDLTKVTLEREYDSDLFLEHAPAESLFRKFGNLLTKNGLFWLCFIFPVGAATIYYTFISADMYVSEARFIVRSSSIAPRLNSGSNNIGQVTTMVRTNDDTQSVNAYISSRDSLDRLIRENNFLDV